MKKLSLFLISMTFLLGGCAGLKGNWFPSPESAIDNTPKVDPRLSAVKKIYIDSLGNEEGSDLVREKIRKLLAESGRLSVVERAERADAVLTGVAGVERSYSSSIGTDSRTGAVSGSGGTNFKGVGILRLVDVKEEEPIWFFEYQRGLSFSSASSRVANQVVDKLMSDVLIADKNSSIKEKVGQ
jgi:hypothetical protein